MLQRREDFRPEGCPKEMWDNFSNEEKAIHRQADPSEYDYRKMPLPPKSAGKVNSTEMMEDEEDSGIAEGNIRDGDAEDDLPTVADPDGKLCMPNRTRYDHWVNTEKYWFTGEYNGEKERKE